MSLLGLPTELLDQIFSYLDWDRTQTILPAKETVQNASLTCKHLRKALTPILFRDVVLRLRWADETLIEPLLFKLRRDRPELAQHIRCVHIRAEFQICLHCAERDNSAPFVVPEDSKDWLNPSGSSQYTSTEQETVYRSRVNVLAQKIVNPLSVYGGNQSTAIDSAEDAILSFKRRNGRNSDLDALSIVMLCIPATTTTIVFQALTDSYTHETKNNFAVRLLATALDLHRHRIQDLTMVSNASPGRLTMSRRALARLGTGGSELDAVPPEVLRDLKTHRLLIAIDDSFTFRTPSTSLTSQSYQRWHQMSHCIRELELRYTHANINEMLQFIKGFRFLTAVRIRQCVLDLPHQPMMPRRHEWGGSTWLAFAIDLRRSMQHVQIELSNLHQPNVFDPIPEYATRWIASQAVPQGCLIDADREERLLEDFASFAELWLAEQGERGAQALSAWETQRAELSDEAMSRRWR